MTCNASGVVTGGGQPASFPTMLPLTTLPPPQPGFMQARLLLEENPLDLDESNECSMGEHLVKAPPDALDSCMVDQSLIETMHQIKESLPVLKKTLSSVIVFRLVILVPAIVLGCLGLVWGYDRGIVGTNLSDFGSELYDEDAMESKCPKYWADATHMNLGCVLFNATTKMSWHDAQNVCQESYSSHLVEIFSQEQQDFVAMKAFEAELLTGTEQDWWIGLTDDNSEGRWYWIHSLKSAEFIPWGVWQPDGDKAANFASLFAGFDYRWTDETSAFEYRGGAYPICQFSV